MFANVTQIYVIFFFKIETQNLNNMDKDNNNTKVDNTDKKLHISDVMNSFLEDFVIGAKKQKHTINTGGWGHAIWCNYQRPEGSGNGGCNCGVSDIQTTLDKYEKFIQNCS